MLRIRKRSKTADILNETFDNRESEEVKTLPQRVLLLTGVILLSASICGCIAWLQAKWSQGPFHQDVLSPVIAGTLASIPGAVLSLLFQFRHGTGIVAILAATALRFGLTLGLAAYAAWSFPSLRSLTFFLTVSVVYLVSLFVETWLTYQDHFQDSPR